MVGHSLGCLEISFERCFLDELHTPYVREPSSSHGITDKFCANVEIQAGQIGDRVTVLGARKTSHDDATRIASVLLGDFE